MTQHYRLQCNWFSSYLYSTVKKLAIKGKMRIMARVRAKVRTIRKICDFFFFFFLILVCFFFCKALRKDWTYFLGKPTNIGQIVARNELGKSRNSFYECIEELYFNYFFVIYTKELVLGIKFGRGKK